MRFTLLKEAELQAAKEVLGITNPMPQPESTRTENEAIPHKQPCDEGQEILLIHLQEDTSAYNLLAIKTGRGKLGMLDKLRKRGYPSATEDSVKYAMKELRSLKLLSKGKSGPGGGSYITALGKRVATKINESR